MTQSEQINDLAAALAKAQGEMENAAKNANNPHFKSRYADLAEILNTVRAPLAKHGLSVVQSQALADGVVMVETLLMHSSGQWVRTTCTATVTKTDPQAIGSAITYCRRYSLAAACGIAQEDDDGEAAQGGGRQQSAKRQAKPEPVQDEAAASEGQKNEIAERMMDPLVTDKERADLRKWMSGAITEAQAAQALDTLSKRIADRTDAREAA
jgi:hypothetical protein